VLKTTVAPGSAAIDLSLLVIHEIQLIGSRCGPFSEALAALGGQKIDVLSLISRRMKLSEGVEALKASKRKDVVKVLLEP
jgi:alcohol dehydrogenase